MPKHSDRSMCSVAAQLAGYAAFLPSDALTQRLHGPLAKIAAALSWSALRDLLAPIEAEADQRHGGPSGLDPLALTAAVLLGRWHGLGERALADALARRWDFQLFCGFDADRPTPSGSTLRRHAQRLKDADVLDLVVAEVDAALSAARIKIIPSERALVDLKLQTLKNEV